MTNRESEGIRKAKARFTNIASELKKGASHPTLGFHAHGGEQDWWKAGEKNFQKMVRLFAINKSDRVVDYGCGSLRVGAHFIRYLEPVCYAGLEVTSDLIDMGKQVIGTDILEEKRPLLAEISETSIQAARDMEASLVFSHAVAKNVVRDELDFYLSALRTIAHKPGCVLYFSAKLADAEVEYSPGGWARSLDAYAKPLFPLTLAKIHGDSDNGGAAAAVRSCKLEFRHP